MAPVIELTPEFLYRLAVSVLTGMSLRMAPNPPFALWYHRGDNVLGFRGFASPQYQLGDNPYAEESPNPRPYPATGPGCRRYRPRGPGSRPPCPFPR